jgi:hypothetical protein
MASRPLCCGGVAVASWLLCSVVTPTLVDAQPRTWVTSLNYESSRLVVPVIVVVSSNDDGREWRLGLTGWTLTGDWKTPADDRRKRHVFARITPINANSSNFIYRDGIRHEPAEYRASAAEGGAGIEFAHTRRWTGGYRALVMYQRVGGLADTDVATFWRRPFAGVELTQQYARVTSDERFGSRWEGVKIAATGRAMAGAHTWSRAELTAGVGKRAGPIFLSGRGAAFVGRSLNIANAFVLGGSWDVPSADMLPGYRYAEFRLERAGSVGAAVDIRLHGPWEVGLRGGWLTGPATNAHGAALQVGTVWRGATFNAGVAFPHHGSADQFTRSPIVYATVTAAIIER